MDHIETKMFDFSATNKGLVDAHNQLNNDLKTFIMHFSPSVSLHKDLLDARLTLCLYLMNEYESQLKQSKVAHYHLMNNPSKLMARRVAAVRHKTKIPFLLFPTRSHKICNPQDIADAFSDYYSKLYNLKGPEKFPLRPNPRTTKSTAYTSVSSILEKTPIRFIPLHIPDLHMESWMDVGIHSLNDLYDGATIHPTLQTKYGLPPSDLFKYTQISHLPTLS